MLLLLGTATADGASAYQGDKPLPTAPRGRPIDTMMVLVTTTESLRILRNDRSGPCCSSSRSVTPPAGDAPCFNQASAPVAAAALEAGLASWDRAGSRARRLGADGDRGYAPRLRLTLACTGLKPEPSPHFFRSISPVIDCRKGAPITPQPDLLRLKTR